jgi:carnitine-CoA ligase
VAVRSEHTEDEIKAGVVMGPDVVFEPESILRGLADRLTHSMVPRYYETVDAIPKTPTHKVIKGEHERPA